MDSKHMQVSENVKKMAHDWVEHRNSGGCSFEFDEDCLAQLLADALAAERLKASNDGFELAHELAKCGHARANYRDPNYKSGDAECDSSKCEFCEAIKQIDEEWLASVKFKGLAAGPLKRLQERVRREEAQYALESIRTSGTRAEALGYAEGRVAALAGSHGRG